MSKRKTKHNRQAEPAAPAARGWSVGYTVAMAVTAVAGVMIGLGVRNAMLNTSPTAFTSNATPLADNTVDQREVVDETQSNPKAPLDLQKLKGQWVRADGGYVLDIQRVDSSGRLDAAYLNPQPIHVAKAEATRQGTSAKVVIELQDVNYPGSTYDLNYDAASDRLVGTYFQAVQQQQFAVSFDRVAGNLPSDEGG